MTVLLYTWLIVIGSIDVLLVAPALARARNDQMIGRLVATLATLSGMVLGSVGRLAENRPLPLLPGIGVVLIDVGLLGYAIFLPENGLLGWARKRRQ